METKNIKQQSIIVIYLIERGEEVRFARECPCKTRELSGVKCVTGNGK